MSGLQSHVTGMSRAALLRIGELLAPRCGACGHVLGSGPATVNFGDLQYHPDCRPACDVCATPLEPGGVGWRSEGHVVSEPWGYRVCADGFWCPVCLGSAPRDEPRSSF